MRPRRYADQRTGSGLERVVRLEWLLEWLLERRSEPKAKAAQNVAKANPVWDGDSEHWEKEGTNYDDDPLPYLVSGYGETVVDARQDAGLQREELADELGIREQDLLAVEQGRATQAGIGGGVIAALEERLDVTLSE